MMTIDVDMPGRPIQHWHAEDTGNLGDLATAAFDILGRCIQPSPGLSKKSGWKNVGTFRLVFRPPSTSMADELFAGSAQSIGVILWATDSIEDRRVPAYSPTAARCYAGPLQKVEM